MPLLKMDLFSTLGRGIVCCLIPLPVEATAPIVKAFFFFNRSVDFLGDRHVFESSITFSKGTVCSRVLPGLLKGWRGTTFCSWPHHRLKSFRKSCSLSSYPEAPADICKTSNPGLNLAICTM